MVRGGTRCKEHANEDDRERGTSTERGYGYRWRVAAKRFLSEHPMCQCEDCKGRYRRATVVDHIIPHRGNQDRFWDENNWQPMAKVCHDRKTARETNTGRQEGG